MPNGPSIAKAYVQIIPSAQGIKGSLSNLFSGEAESAGKSVGGKFSSALGSALKIGGAALTAAAGSAAALTKAAIGSYADYEQLVGGVETLFSSLDGTISAAPEVLTNASNAFKTAGLSANEYMESVTGFAAALTSSLGGDYSKAASFADMAITDMADNANKMGTSMESIQNAYQGFAKQNYTMLDNLKLGYGGTKEEMARLLADAEAFSGVHYDISNLGDVYEAIHVVQTELGITGTTAKEAASTISGSLAMTKSSWTNLITGIADDNADFGALIGDFVDSASIAAGNLIPRISQALSGIGNVITGLAPVIASALPPLISGVLPDLLSAGMDLITAIGTGIVQNLPALVNTAVQIIPTLITGISSALPELISYLPEIIATISITLIDNLPVIIDAGMQLLIAVQQGFIQALPKMIGYVPQIVSSLFRALVSGVGQMVSGGAQLLSGVMQGLRAELRAIASIGMDVVRGIWQGISNGLSWIKSMITGWVGNVKNFLKSLFGINSPSTWARDMLGVNIARGIGVGFEDEMVAVERSMEDAMPDLSGSVQFEARTAPVRSAVFSENAENDRTSGEDFAKSIQSAADRLESAIRDMKIYLDTGELVGAVDKGLGRTRASIIRRSLA